MEWNEDPPHTRPLRVSPLICLDALHSSHLNALEHSGPPHLIIVPSSAEPSLAAQVIRYSRQASIQSASALIVCSHGISSMMDEFGRTTYLQHGSKSFTLGTGVTWYPDSKGETRTIAAAYLGTSGTLLLGTIILALWRLSQKPALKPLEAFLEAVWKSMIAPNHTEQSTEGHLPVYSTDWNEPLYGGRSEYDNNDHDAAGIGASGSVILDDDSEDEDYLCGSAPWMGPVI